MSELINSECKCINDFPMQAPEVDYTGSIKRAFEYGVAAKRLLPIIFPNDKVYRISSRLKLDVNYNAMVGYNFIIDSSAITQGEALFITGTVYPSFKNTITVTNGLQLRGISQFDQYPITSEEVAAGKDKSTTGIRFGGSGVSGPAHVNLFNTNIYGFGKGVEYGNNSYIITFFNSNIYWCGLCIDMPKGLTNYGERLTFISCSFYNSDNLIKQSNAHGSMKFITCSFDYQSYKVFHITGGRITVIGGHIEADSDNDFWWYVEGNGSLLQLQGVEIVAKSDKDGKSNSEIGYSHENTALGGIQLTDCFMSIPKYNRQFLIGGNGRVIVNNLVTNQYDKRFAISKGSNRLRDGEFKNDEALLDWNIVRGVPVIDTTVYNSGQSSLKFVSPDTKGIVLKKEFACSPNELVTTTLFVKTENLAINAKNFYIQRLYLDANGNVLLDMTKIFSEDIDWRLCIFQDNKPAPPGTEKFQLRISTGLWNTDCSAWIDDVYITKN